MYKGFRLKLVSDRVYAQGILLNQPGWRPAEEHVSMELHSYQVNMFDTAKAVDEKGTIASQGIRVLTPKAVHVIA